MTPAGYSGTPLARKLGIRVGHRVGAIGEAAHLRELLGALPADASFEADPTPGEAPGPFDVAVVFVPDRESLPALRDAVGLIGWDGGLWAAWPKQSSPLATEMKEGDVRSAGLAAGLVDNKICAIDEDWSGLRFVYRKEDRPKG